MNIVASIFRNGFVQVAVAIALGALVPSLAYDALSPTVSIHSDNIVNAMTYIVISILLARFVLHEMKKFAIVRGVEVILPIYSASFAASGAVILFFRENYSTIIFALGFVISTLLAMLFEVFFKPSDKGKYILVPSEKVDRIKSVLRAPVIAADLSRIPDSDDTIIVADLHAQHPASVDDYFAKAALGGVKVYHYKNLMETLTGRVRVEHLSENSFGTLTPNSIYARGKDAVDRVVALIALVILAIPMLLVAVIVRLDSPGPALFTQQRIGYRARSFKVYKFRTMYHGAPAADEQESAAVTRDRDPRITRLGSFLRRSRIDELPQLINILKGEMSWIGPRPEAIELSELYQPRIAFYAYRHIIRPGITGWAQVHQGHVTELDAIQRKLEYDFYYIKNFSLWLDALIAIKTLQVMLNGYGAK